jgi:TM2 domain-containing membrane protein YozV
MACERPAEGTVYCQDHVPVPAYGTPPDPNPGGAANPYYQAPVSQAAAPPGPRTGVQTSPALAFIFGLFIPGVGAIYNGQYLKGLVHAIIFGLLISLISSAEDTPGEPFLAMILVGFIFYMAFEAYHTAQKRRLGIPVEEWSSLLGSSRSTSRVPIGPILLIAIGFLFLLDTLHVIEFRQIGRFWPVILILVGAFMLYNRLSGTRVPPPASEPYRDPGATRPTNG